MIFCHLLYLKIDSQGMWSFLLPFKNDNSIKDRKQTTFPPEFEIKLHAASAVPPVAKRSSTSKNSFFDKFGLTSKVSCPYSSS